MKLRTKGWALLTALVAGGLLAVPTPALASKVEKDLSGAAHITDDALLFSADAKRQSEQKMSNAKFNRGLHFSVDTHKNAPPEWRSKYEAAGDKKQVVKDWAKTIAKGDREK